MMAESVLTFKYADVQKLIQPMGFSNTSFLILETMDTRRARPVLGMSTYVIVDTLGNARENPNGYPAGRIFDDTGELKWQQQGASFQCVYIGTNANTQNLPVGVQQLTDPATLTMFKDKDVYLWGEKVSRQRLQSEIGVQSSADIWVELQIPQYLSYPVQNLQDRDRVRMQVREFYDNTGNLEYYRFVTMKK